MHYDSLFAAPIFPRHDILLELDMLQLKYDGLALSYIPRHYSGDRVSSSLASEDDEEHFMPPLLSKKVTVCDNEKGGKNAPFAELPMLRNHTPYFYTTVLCSLSSHVLNVPLIPPNFHVLLIHAIPNGPTICHLLLAAPSFNGFLLFLSLPLSHTHLSVIGFQEKEGTSIPIFSYSFFFQSYLQVLSGHSCNPLYAFPGLRIRRASEKAVYQISTMGCSFLQRVLSSPLIPPMSRQGQWIMRWICTIAPFACDDDKRIPT